MSAATKPRVLVCPDCGWLYFRTARTPKHRAPNFGTGGPVWCSGAGKPGLTQREAFERSRGG